MTKATNDPAVTHFLRRRDAAEYLVKTYGFGAERTLAKGVVTGDTPEFHKAGRGNYPVDKPNG